ncbi:PP2C family protein-serine/threonine phosphatase [Actinomadura barringtoniae]|uniref:PP2C family protein-serine/threonine phosphatase n=1 Tax=Actinomadura barringtoniae TaxID=1427535 RepID=UPI0027DACE9F|nr:PP2C family protein-serine/threonine phosphatase [Actinomadura barringtoniae]
MRRLLSTTRTKGDFHAVVPTPYGTRILVGDVLGATESAEETAAGVVDVFRQLAVNERPLSGVAERMNAALGPKMKTEEFVTAVLITLHPEDGRAEMVCCGNPPPLLLRENRALPIESLPTYPPLSLLDLTNHWCETTTVPVRPDDRLLLCTHGASEAGQKHGYPLAERISSLQTDEPAVLLDGIQSDLLQHSGDEIPLQTTFLLARFDRPPAHTAIGRAQPTAPE